MARTAKCRVCGAKLDTTTAYKVIVCDTNNREKRFYYCSKDEYEADEARKKKEAADKDKAYGLICEIIGRKKIINTALWKEWKLWSEVASDEVIAQYLEENKDYLTGAIARLDDVEYNRIRYLSAVLRNSLGDYKPKVKKVGTPKTEIDMTFYEPAPTYNNKRRSLADLEDGY